MLIPKRTKYRKQHRPTRSGMSKGGNEIAFGDFGIQALAPAYVTNRQIEAARIAMTDPVTYIKRAWVAGGPCVDHRVPGSSAHEEAAGHPNGFR